MPIAFCLISSSPGKERDVYKELKKTPGVIEVNPLFGPYDAILKIEADDYRKIGSFVTEKIRSIPGIVETKTLPIHPVDDDWKKELQKASRLEFPKTYKGKPA